MSEGDLPILRPLPRRTFQFTPASNDPSPSDSPPTDEPDSSKLQASEGESKLPPSRTMSILNLTSSTLFGIYSDATTRDDISMGNTPWGTGSQTPATPGRSFLQDQRSPVIGAMERGNRREHSSPNAHRHGQTALAVLLRSILLFAFGMAYGVIVSHLQDNQHLIPVRVGGVDRDSLAYLIFWGTAGVGLGTLLPWVDILWEQPSTAQEIRSAFGTANGGARKKKEAKEVEDRERGDWNPVVRSVGAFMGVAFAIRRLPWESTLQASLTLALVNPMVWYLVDRSMPGFSLSTIVGIAGTAVVLGVNPDMLPSQSSATNGTNSLISDYISHESIGVSTWIASVLFCSCVCFGNIGRRLALGRGAEVS